MYPLTKCDLNIQLVYIMRFFLRKKLSIGGILDQLKNIYEHKLS
jgi:hypothetical protein